MTSIRTLAAEFDMEPYAVVTALDLPRDCDEAGELLPGRESMYREVLQIMADQHAEQAE